MTPPFKVRFKDPFEFIAQGLGFKPLTTLNISMPTIATISISRQDQRTRNISQQLTIKYQTRNK